MYETVDAVQTLGKPVAQTSTIFSRQKLPYCKQNSVIADFLDRVKMEVRNTLYDM